MRIVRYRVADDIRWGVMDDEQVVAAEGTTIGDLTATDRPIGSVEQVGLVAPVAPRAIVCVGRNYAAHAEELGNEAPGRPLLFLKPPSSVIGPGQPIVRPAASDRVEHEAELAVVIGRRAHQVPHAEASSVIGGFTCANDVTARDLQKTDPGGQWTRGKGFATFCPVGPWIETDLDPADLRVRCSVDGELRQDGRTSAFLFDLPTLIEYITAFMVLDPGDLILTGTPAGVGPLPTGSSVTVEVEGIGTLTNPVVGAF